MKEHIEKCPRKGVTEAKAIPDCTCDGYHTFDELYDHRITLFIALCRCMCRIRKNKFWRSKLHSDCTMWEGWFIMGITTEEGEQITYHIPIERWVETRFVETLDKAPEFDGHTSDDVIERLKKL